MESFEHLAEVISSLAKISRYLAEFRLQKPLKHYPQNTPDTDDP